MYIDVRGLRSVKQSPDRTYYLRPAGSNSYHAFDVTYPESWTPSTPHYFGEPQGHLRFTVETRTSAE